MSLVQVVEWKCRMEVINVVLQVAPMADQNQEQ